MIIDLLILYFLYNIAPQHCILLCPGSSLHDVLAHISHTLHVTLFIPDILFKTKASCILLVKMADFLTLLSSVHQDHVLLLLFPQIFEQGSITENGGLEAT